MILLLRPPSVRWYRPSGGISRDWRSGFDRSAEILGSVRPLYRRFKPVTGRGVPGRTDWCTGFPCTRRQAVIEPGSLAKLVLFWSAYIILSKE